MNKKLIAGILTGIAAGTLLGVLFAPEKGKKTRNKILDSGNAIADDLKNKFTQLVDQAQKKTNLVKKS